MKKSAVLIILDGWGYRAEREYNAIAQANTPHWDHLWQTYPHTLLSASSETVGLPPDQIGNSEVGHLHMGAGRIVPQELSRINQAIRDNAFAQNPALTAMVSKLKAHAEPSQADKMHGKNKQQIFNTANRFLRQPSIHIIGLASPGGVHSHINHIQAMADFANAQQTAQACYIHAILDGRDVPPQSALAPLRALENHLANHTNTHIASIIGRYYAMDRDQRWERTQQAYDMLTQGKVACRADSVTGAIEIAYARGETDEFVRATLIQPTQKPYPPIQDGDTVIFMNFRADRARQLTQAFVLEDFQGFKRESRPQLSDFLTLTEYQKDLPVSVISSPNPLKNILGQCIADQQYKQLRIAETEKYAHVTFFFNGGRETPFPGETRELIPSPKVATYDLQPEMSALELTDKLVEAINSQEYAIIICNYANADMVGHTGNFQATIKAIETIDQCLGSVEKALSANNTIALITADHGNAEKMFDQGTDQAHTAHTQQPVPCLCIAPGVTAVTEQGNLYDIAPTLLKLLGLDIPAEMTGVPLFQRENTHD